MSSKQPQKVPPLTKGPVPLAPVKEKARVAFLDIIDSMIGAKALVFDSALDGTLGLIITASVLSEHGIEEMYHLGQQLVEPRSKNILYISRADVVNAKLIAEQIKGLNATDTPHEYAVYFVPRVSCLCEKIFEEEGVKGDTVMGALPFDFIPFDEDLLSLELEHSFRENIVDGDPTAHYLLARALTQFQLTVGAIPRVVGKGHAAEAVSKILSRMNDEIEGMPPPGSIKKMLLLDRAVDLITPMVTQVTYEGMIDEILGIKNNTVSLEVKDRGGNVEKKKYVLNSSDAMHSEMRDVPWSRAAPKIRDWVQKMKRDWQSIKQDSSSKSVSEMRDFASRLTQLGSTEMHSNICDPIAKTVLTEGFKERISIERQVIEEGIFDEGVKYVEEMLQKGCEFFVAVRLLCLLSIINNGIPKKSLDGLKKVMLLCYGYENLSFLNHLETAGLLQVKVETKSQFPVIRRILNLAVPDEDESSPEGEAPKDISYIYWGYAPISIRLVEHAILQKRAAGFSNRNNVDFGSGSAWIGKGMDAINLLPGPHFDITIGDSLAYDNPKKTALGDRSETVLVVFIGGVTFSEISALRLLSSLTNRRTKFVVATTHLMNGNTFLKTFQDQNVQRIMEQSKAMLID